MEKLDLLKWDWSASVGAFQDGRNGIFAECVLSSFLMLWRLDALQTSSRWPRRFLDCTLLIDVNESFRCIRDYLPVADEGDICKQMGQHSKFWKIISDVKIYLQFWWMSWSRDDVHRWHVAALKVEWRNTAKSRWLMTGWVAVFCLLFHAASTWGAWYTSSIPCKSVDATPNS